MVQLMAYSSFLSYNDDKELPSSHDSRALLQQLVVVKTAFPFLWNPKFRSSIDKIVPLNKVLREFSKSHIITNYFSKVH
jgi:hypothetical protein